MTDGIEIEITCQSIRKKVKIDTEPNGTVGDLRRHLRSMLATQRFEMKSRGQYLSDDNLSFAECGFMYSTIVKIEVLTL